MTDMGERLKEAVEFSRFPSFRKFAAAFAAKAKEMGVGGHSIPTIYRHIRGEGDPPSDYWLQVFSDVAGVRLEWVRDREVARTEARAAALRLSGLLPEGSDFDIDEESVPALFAELQAARALANMIASGVSDPETLSEEWMDEVLIAVIHLVGLPLLRLPVGPPGPPPLAAAAYGTTQLAWLMTLMGDRPHGMTTAETLKHLRGEAQTAGVREFVENFGL